MSDTNSKVVASKGEAAGRISGVHHLLMIVPDMGETLRFYRDLLGLKVVKTLGKIDAPSGPKIGRNYFFELGDGSLLGLVEYDGAAPSGPIYRGTHISTSYSPLWPGDVSPANSQKVDHIAFNVPTRDDVLWFMKRLRDHGVETSDLIEYAEPSGAQFVISIYFYDPFGNPLELGTFDLGDPDVESRLRRDLWFADDNPPPELME
jgi:catechol 2,3-dioxygenase-like lactoylglutathione lyase family enzyme